MKCACLGTVWLSLAVLFAGSGIWQAVARADQVLSVQEIVRRAVAQAHHVETATTQTGYTYTKVSVVEELDSTGKLKDRKEKVYQVFFQGGSTHVKLLEVNGRAPVEADLKKQAENEMNIRQMNSPSKSAKGANRENLLKPDLVARYDFKLSGQKTMNGRPSYEISFQPKSPCAPQHRLLDKLLDRLSGTIWIDAAEFELARAEVQLGSEVELLGGVIGCLRKLAFTMSRTRVAEGVWFSSFSNGDFEGRKLLESKRIKTRSQSSNFRLLAAG